DVYRPYRRVDDAQSAELEVEIRFEIEPAGLQRTVIGLAEAQIEDAPGRTACDREGFRYRIADAQGVENLLRSEKVDAVGDLDRVVIQREIEPAGHVKGE